ncbi:hypothetical protein J6590_014357 [Homalodisca vitripennis]|nr:hypothetical protein J6590_014357 [Homalodisca vitripennis]
MGWNNELKSGKSVRTAEKTIVALYFGETVLHAVRDNHDRHIGLHEHNTGNAIYFSLPIHHLCLYEKKPSYKGALLYNNVPGHLKKETGRLSRQLTA